jgi:hypothetical protein
MEIQSFKHQQMMKKGLGMRVRIAQDRSTQIEEGLIRIQSWNKRERLVRALKSGGLCWIAALVSIFIPLLHFILVPGFLIAGPILVYFIFGQENRVLGGEGVCPFCHAPLILASATLNFPISDLCTDCHNSLKIEPWDSFKV